MTVKLTDALIQSTLEFNLHTQCFIEKIRAKDYMGAIQYAQRFLVESEGMSKEKLQETMVLLAFKPSTECEKYKVLLLLVIQVFGIHFVVDICV